MGSCTLNPTVASANILPATRRASCAASRTIRGAASSIETQPAPQDEGNHLAAGGGILDDRAEQFPPLAIELHHLQLLVDAVIGRRGAAGDTGQEYIALNVLQAGGLLHDVLAGEVVAAACEYFDQQLRGHVAIGIEARILVAF